MVRRSRLEDDTLRLLTYVSEHRFEYQDEKSLGKAIGVSQQRVSEIINSPQHIRAESVFRQGGPNCGCLPRTASKYGFEYRLYRKRRGLLIDVVYVGRVREPAY